MPRKKKTNTDLESDDCKSNRSKLLNEKMSKIEKDISQTGEFDKDEAVLVMYLAFFNEDSIYNIKAVHKKVNAMGEKLKNLNDNVENLETKIRMIELESHQTKILIKKHPFIR